MAAYGRWADLADELLLTITHGYSLEQYVLLRSVCAAWRSALAFSPAPPLPSLLVLNDSASSLLSQRSLHLSTDTLDNGNRFTCPGKPHRRNRVVGSSNGWLAVACDLMGVRPLTVWVFLLNPHTSEEIKLLPPRNARYLRKIVFAPDPKPQDCTSVAIWDLSEVAYINDCRDTEWTIIDVDHTEQLDLAYDAESGKVYCLDWCGGVRILHTPCWRMQKPTVERLLARRASNQASVFAPPYDSICSLTFTKNLFLYDGSLYQVWQNNSSTAKLHLQAGGRFTMFADEIFVMRYDQSRQPSWDVVKDLGGCSVFIGKNSPVVVRAEAVPGARANCIYWIDWLGVPVVCDMATGISAPCVLPYGVCRGSCWYLCDDNVSSIDNNGTKSGYEQTDIEDLKSKAKLLKI